MSDSGSEQAPADEAALWREFGEWVAGLRKDRGLTQMQVATRAGVSTQNIVTLEHGGFRRQKDARWELPNPKDDTLKALARIYRVTAEELFQRVGRFDDRPQTHRARRQRAATRKASRGDRLAEIEARFTEQVAEVQRQAEEIKREYVDQVAEVERLEREVREANERTAELQRELKRTTALLRRKGILPPGEDGPRRRRATG
jgi:transcriptional regulator with XRE-family HTH domain